MIVVEPARKIGGDSCMVHVESLAEGCLTEVEIKKKGLRALKSHGGGHVHDDEGLSCVRIEGGDHYLTAAFMAAEHEIDVGSQHSEGLVDGITLALFYDYAAVVVVVLVASDLVDPSCRNSDLRNFSKERNGKFGKV